MNNHRLQILYQKTEFNNHKICQMDGIFKCCKCKKNNSLLINNVMKVQLCLFCGTPNNIKREMESMKNIR